ncbi:MAG: DnaD domain protein [Bacilli bacterium]|nr:DnaD domain protein [Bacilli bacterium]
MEYVFTDKDNYIVYANSILSTHDRKIMATLYLPLIGVNAFSLYFVLWSDLEGDSAMSKIKRPVTRLDSMLNMSLIDITKACYKLEALGLLQRYKNEGDYILILKSPKSANAFFRNDLLFSMLKDRIGEVEFERSKLYFSYKPKLPSGYINVSKQFCEIYEYPNDYDDSEKQDLVERSEGKIELNYDFDQLYSGLVNVSKFAFTDKVKETIGNIMYYYNISIVDMRGIIMKAYNFSDLSIDCDRIRYIAETFYKENRRKLNVKSEQNTANNKVSGNDDIDAFIEFCNTHTVFQFLEAKDGVKPSGPDLNLLIELKNNYNLSDAVLNVIIDYCLKRNNNRLTRSYVLKIASSLNRSKIDNVYDAMMALKYPNMINKKENIKIEQEDETIDDQDILEIIKKLDRGES